MGRILLAAPILCIGSATLAYGQESMVFGVQRTNAEIMAAAQTTTAAPSESRAVDVPLERFGTSLQEHLESDRATAASGAGGLRVDLTFVGATGQGVPDTMGAAGPTQYLVVLNSVVRSFNKNTGVPDGVLNVSLQAFFAGTGYYACCDPKVRFDRLSGRWFVGSFQSGRVLLAVSNGGVLTPQSAWRFFSFLQDQASPPGDTGCWVDYTRMSVDAQAVYFVFGMWTANYQAPCAGNATGSTAFVIRKTSVLGAGPLVATAFRGSAYFQVPADQFESGSDVGYITTLFHPTQSGSYYRINDPGGTPSLSPEVPYSGVPALGSFAPVRHKGNALESGVPGDTSGRMFLGNSVSHSVPVRRGRLWLGSLVGVNNLGTASSATRNGLRFTELRDVNAAPALVQNGLLFEPSANNDYDQRNYWVPALMVNGQGHMLLAGSAAGTNEYINAAIAGRLATDAPGTIRPAVLYTNATETYTGAPDPNRGNTRRWGDYSNISLDPCDDMTMWAIQQFAVTGSVWGVAVARVKAPPPPPVWSITPRVLPRNLSSVNVTITGTAPDGEGFYDPGPGFPCRLGAALDDGVTVNAVTYNSPTSITLNVSTSGASHGAHALTITNPDGQSITMPTAVAIGVSPGDFDGDGRADITVFRPSTGQWFIRQSGTQTLLTLVWGGGSDKPVPGDYDGDGKFDIAVFRPSTGEWFVRQSSTFTLVTLVWGGSADVPVQADYDGDGKTDIAIFRPSTGEWFIRQSSTFTLVTLIWGGGADIPVHADYDGDGRFDIAIFRPSTGEWFVRQSSTLTLVTLVWGGGADVPVPGDYDGDGKTDIAVFRPSTGQWFVRQSSTFTLLTLVWGGGTDIPVPGDYDGDGKVDIAIFRRSTGEWFVRQSSTFTLVTLVWGGGSDIPILMRP